MNTQKVRQAVLGVLVAAMVIVPAASAYAEYGVLDGEPCEFVAWIVPTVNGQCYPAWTGWQWINPDDHHIWKEWSCTGFMGYWEGFCDSGEIFGCPPGPCDALNEEKTVPGSPDLAPELLWA